MAWDSQGNMGEGFTNERLMSMPAMQVCCPLLALTQGLGKDMVKDLDQMINREEDGETEVGSPMEDLMSKVDKAIEEVNKEKRRREEGEEKKNRVLALVEIKTSMLVHLA
jgi:hypothetical protein